MLTLNPRPINATSQHILDAAGPIFAKKGFHATTVREITREAKVNVAAVNYHFRDKQELYVKVCLSMAHQAAGATKIAQADFTGTPEQQLRIFIGAFLGYLLDPERPEWQGRLIAREMAEPTRALDRLVEESILPVKKQLHGIVHELLGPGVPEARVHLACLSVIGQCLHYVHCRQMIGRLFPSNRQVHRDVDTLANHIFEFSLAGLAGIAPPACHEAQNFSSPFPVQTPSKISLMSNEPEKKEAPKEPSPMRTMAIRIVIGTIMVVGMLWGIKELIHSHYYESTDDAFIEGHVATIGTKLSNTVQSVLIDDNYEVKQGDLLVQIDPRDYEVQLRQAQANYDKAKADYARDVALSNSKAISKQDLDATQAIYNVTAAQLDQAKLNLEYTHITAPMSGRITRKNVEPGDYIQTGETLFSIVPHDIWIIANFKETQLTHMEKGQPVTIQIDAFPGKTFKGHVDSLQAGTGARFSLLPAENATGNYVKVVQRVPVKIVFDESTDVQALITLGLSVTPEVRVR